MAVQMTKSQLIEKIAVETEVAKKDVKGVLETLATIGYRELTKVGVFLMLGFAKFVVVKKLATKVRKGTGRIKGRLGVMGWPVSRLPLPPPPPHTHTDKQG